MVVGRHVAQLASWHARRSLATSNFRLPSMSCWGSSKRTSAPLMPAGMDPRERHHTGPIAYMGKTPVEIIAKFKDAETFPWYRLPTNLRTKRFEMLWQMAHR